MSTKRNNGIKFFDTKETEPKNIITMDGIKNSTTDAYNKADYKWDPQLKKTVYVGKKKTEAENKSNKEMSTKEKQGADEKESIKQKVSKIVGENGKYRYGGYEPGSGHYLEFYFDGKWKRYNELTETEKEKQKKWDETYKKILLESENKPNNNKKGNQEKIYDEVKNILSSKFGYIELRDIKNAIKNDYTIELTGKAYGDSFSKPIENVFGDKYKDLKKYSEQLGLKLPEYVYFD